MVTWRTLILTMSQRDGERYESLKNIKLLKFMEKGLSGACLETLKGKYYSYILNEKYSLSLWNDTLLNCVFTGVYTKTGCLALPI